MAKVEPEPEFGVDGEELLERDCYGTTRELIDLHDLTFGHGPTLDPFFDPESPVKAVAAISIRKSDAREPNSEEGLGPIFTGSAYRENWQRLSSSAFGNFHLPTFLANPPYSGGHLAKAHRKISLEVRAGMRGIRVCPFSPGTIYWKRYVLPIFSAIACIGRHGFIALRDMRDAKGKLAVKKGTVADQNRTEMCVILDAKTQDELETFVDVAAGHGWPCLFPKSGDTLRGPRPEG